MNIFRNIIAVILGAIIGAMLNGWIIGISGDLVPLPEGVNPNDINSIKENIHLYTPVQLLMPFLAHALGALVGAIIAGLTAYSHKMKFAISIGALFLIGGIMMVVMLPEAPLWFSITDILFAYIPMGYLGGLIALNFTPEPEKV